MRYVNITWQARGVLFSRSCLMSPISTTVCNKSKLLTRPTSRLFTHLISFVHSFVRSFLRSFVPSFFRSFIRSFVRSFIRDITSS